MIKYGVFLLSFIWLFCCGWVNAQRASDVLSEDWGRSTNQQGFTYVIVLEDPRSARSRAWRGGPGYQSPGNYQSNLFLQRYSKNFSEEFQIKLVSQWPINSLNVHCLVVNLEKESQLESIKLDSRVKWVQPHNQFEGLSNLVKEKLVKPSESRRDTKSDKSYTDPYFELQKAFTELNLDKVPPIFNGDGVKIAMIDSGVEHGHPDFKQANIYYENFVEESTLIEQRKKRNNAPGERHGTGIAGVIIAQRNNGTGIAGIAPSATLFGLRGCWEQTGGKTRCNTLTLARALDRVVEISPDILNLSLSGPKDQLLDSIVDAIISKGTIVVAAYDSQRDTEQRFPSQKYGVIYVSESIDLSSTQSNYLFVPGKEIITAQPDGTYAFMSGSSLSSAHLSGVLALFKQADNNISYSNLIEISEANQYVDACRILNTLSDLVQCSN